MMEEDMKKVIIKKIDVGSIAKPLFLIMTLVSLIMGLFMSLFMLPVSRTHTFSSDGVVINEITSKVTGLWSSIIGMVTGIFIYMMVIYLVVLIVLFFLNLFCRYTGGIGIEVEVPEE